jgi:hypothetical protein
VKLQRKCIVTEEEEDTHNALRGACGEGELLVCAVVPVQQICAQQSWHRQDRPVIGNRRNNQRKEGGRESLEKKKEGEILRTSGLLADVRVESRSHGGRRRRRERPAWRRGGESEKGDRSGGGRRPRRRVKMESWQILSLFFVLKVSCYFSSSDLDDSCARVASCIRVARTKQKLSGGRSSFLLGHLHLQRRDVNGC